MNEIHLFNTQSKSKELFSSISRKLKIYTCGPTVYSEAHIGNMRAYVFADTLNRTLRHFGYDLKHVINITDVGHLTDDADDGEDKLEKSAREKKQSAQEIAKKYTQIFFNDLDLLNINRNNYVFPRATEYIEEQIELIKRIKRAGYTYAIEDGIYFDTKKYKGYGALGLSNSDDHARVVHSLDKKSNTDFALWKRSGKDVSRQQEWDSPWGRGFPGWHIECSAMAMKILGESIDIHTGGVDHINIHHNNEIAQSESVTNVNFSKIWMHVAFLNIEGDKFSKSLGNAVTVGELRKEGVSPLALRYFFLTASYRSPLSFDINYVRSSQHALAKLQRKYNEVKKINKYINFLNNTCEYTKAIDNAISDDLNTASVIAILHGIIYNPDISNRKKYHILNYANELLGVLQEKPLVIPREIQTLLEERIKARKDKDYNKSDMLRDSIRSKGYEVLDTEDETLIEKI